MREHVFVGCQVHLVRVHRAVNRHGVADGQIGQQRATEHLEHARHHPARAAHQHTQPPAPAIGRRALGHEAQVVGLLAHLRHQRDADCESGTKQGQVETIRVAAFPFVVQHPGQCTGILHEHRDIGNNQQQEPQRLRPDLQAADGGDTVRDQRNHDQRADQIAPTWRNAECQFQRVGHHRGLQRKEDEGEGCVDQRGDGRADVAKTGAAREQVHVHTVARGVDADRQAGQEDDQAGGQNGPEGVGKAILHQQRGANRFQNQKRCRAKSGVGDAPLGPLAKALRCKAQRVVLHGFARDPGVVITSDQRDALPCVGWRWGIGVGSHTVVVHVSCHGTGIAW